MIRTHLLGAVSALAIFATQGAFAAGPTIVGGGSSLVANDVGNNNLAPVLTGEFALYTSASFIYQKSGSGAGRNSVLQNNEECNVANDAFGTACPAVGSSPAPVAFGNTDAVLTLPEIMFADPAVTTLSQPVVNKTYGDLVQLPFLGTGVAIPEHEATGTLTNGIQTTSNVQLKDADLCGIFSGAFTNWSQTSAASVLGSHTITVIYRSDSSGTTFLFTNHLAGVCAKGLFTATSTFVPPGKGTFVGSKGSSGVQASIAATTYSVGYISPDYTHMVANPPAPPVGNAPYVASVGGLLPSTANISLALNNVDPNNSGNMFFVPPVGSNIAVPTLWVPIVQTVLKGYPIVGYTNMVVPQCFATAAIGTNLVAFLNAHFNMANYLSVQNVNGFVTLPNSLIVKGKTVPFKSTVIADLLTASSAYAIQSTNGCTGHTGRGVGTP